jgi:hypothetical protein
MGSWPIARMAVARRAAARNMVLATRARIRVPAAIRHTLRAGARSTSVAALARSATRPIRTPATQSDPQDMKLMGPAFLIMLSCGGKVIETDGSGASGSTNFSGDPAGNFSGPPGSLQLGGAWQECFPDGGCNPGLKCTSPTALDPAVRCVP